MAKQRLTIERVPESDFVILRYGDKVTACGFIQDGFLIDDWDVHEPDMGFDQKALSAMLRKFGQVGMANGGTTDQTDREGFGTFMYWVEMYDRDLINAVRIFNHLSGEWEWISGEADENPRGGKRKIPRKKKKFWWGISDELFDGLDQDIIEAKAKKISRHLFLQHLYKDTKKRRLVAIEEQAGYGKDEPINQAIDVEYFLSETREGLEIAYFKTPKTGDTLFVFVAPGTA